MKRERQRRRALRIQGEARRLTFTQREVTLAIWQSKAPSVAHSRYVCRGCLIANILALTLVFAAATLFAW